MCEQLDIFSLGIENPNISNDDRDIIKSSELSIIKIRSFLYFRDGWYYPNDKRWHVIFATVALLDNNMVYVKEFYSYPFLYTFENSRAAYKCYSDMIDRCYEYSHGKLSVFREINIHNDFVDMYQCKDNEYSCYEYWHRNFNKIK